MEIFFSCKCLYAHFYKKGRDGWIGTNQHGIDLGSDNCGNPHPPLLSMSDQVQTTSSCL